VRSPDSFRIVIYLLDTKNFIGSKEEMGRFSLFFDQSELGLRVKVDVEDRFEGTTTKRQRQSNKQSERGSTANTATPNTFSKERRQQGNHKAKEKPTTDGGGGKSAGHDTMDRGKMRFKIVVAENGYLQITCTYLI